MLMWKWNVTVAMARINIAIDLSRGYHASSPRPVATIDFATLISEHVGTCSKIEFQSAYTIVSPGAHSKLHYNKRLGYCLVPVERVNGMAKGSKHNERDTGANDGFHRVLSIS